MSSSSAVEVSLRDGLLADVNDGESDDGLDLNLPWMPDADDDDDEATTDALEEDPADVGKDPTCLRSAYGGANDCDEKELQGLIGPNDSGGLVWTAKLVPRETPIKPRRGMPFPVPTEDFLASVKRVGVPAWEAEKEAGYDDLWDRNARHAGGEDERRNARWIFRGVMNGWPGLTLMEARKVRVQEPESFVAKVANKVAKKYYGAAGGARKIWDVNTDGNQAGVELADAVREYQKKGGKGEVLVELRAPAWSSQGWSARSPGFVLWVEGATVDNRSTSPPPALTVTYGTDLLDKFSPKNLDGEDDPVCTMVHMINHRYASPKKSESPKDMITYHSFALLEWDHGKYCTVVEIGYLNGLGGYKGKSNWFDDKDAIPYSRLYTAFPPELVLPWKSRLSEIRITNVGYRNKGDFVANYMEKYAGHQGRFVDVTCSFSNEVRLTFNARSHVITYVLNYILRNKTYSEMRRNCATFAADLCGFLAGKGNVAPYHPINQIQYNNQAHYFLYESSKYSKR